MSQVAGGATGVGGGVGIDQGVQAAGAIGAPATQGSVAVPQDPQGLAAVMRGMQNMLGNTPEEREVNAKALAAGVKDINGLVSSISESTLLKRMMEAQGSGLGFVDPTQGGSGVRPPEPSGGGSMAPIVSNQSFR